MCINLEQLYNYLIQFNVFNVAFLFFRKLSQYFSTLYFHRWEFLLIICINTIATWSGSYNLWDNSEFRKGKSCKIFQSERNIVKKLTEIKVVVVALLNVNR